MTLFHLHAKETETSFVSSDVVALDLVCVFMFQEILEGSTSRFVA